MNNCLSAPEFRGSPSLPWEGEVQGSIEICTYYSLFSSMHISESQQEFFRMLDEKIEKVRMQNK